MERTESTQIYCRVIGDNYVGKSTLLKRMNNENVHIAKEMSKTFFDKGVIEMEHEGKKYEVHLFGATGLEGSVSLRRRSYQNIDVFLVCFQVSNMASFKSVEEIWVQEIKNAAENSILLLIGTKSDLRTDQETIDQMNFSRDEFVSKGLAENFAKEENMYKYIECSSLTNENIDLIKSTILEAYCKSKEDKSRVWANPIMCILNRVCCCRRRY